MSTLAQVRHLFVNEVRRLQWLLAAYAVCVGLAAGTAIVGRGQPGLWQSLIPLLVVLVGLIVVASAIQSDSPWRADAFWVSRPLSVSAVLGTKFLLAAVVTAVPIFGLLWCLSQLGVSFEEYPPVLGRAASSFATILLAGMALAAVTRDLRSFAIAMVSVVVLYVLTLLTPFGRLGSSVGEPSIGSVLHTAALHFGPLAVLVLVYWRRDSVAIARIFGACILVAWFLFTPYGTTTRLPASRPTLAATSADAPAITVALDPAAPSVSSGSIRFRVTGAAWRNAARLVVMPENLLVHLRNGSTIVLKGRMPAFVISVPYKIADGTTWHDDVPDGVHSIALVEGEVAALAPGVASVDLVGRVEAFAIHAAATMPFESGFSSTHQGVLVQLDSVQRDSVTEAAVVTTLTVRPDTVDQAALARRVRFSRLASLLPPFVLLDDSTHLAIRLANASSTASTGWMVLPGTSVRRERTHVLATGNFAASGAGGRRRPVHFMYLDWTLVGSARVRASSADR